MAEKRATIVLTGEVQDAGFRGKVMRIAQKLDLVGYIENLPNGTVRLICEGQETTINDFVEMLDIHDDDIDVEDTSVEWSDANGEFEWFEVKFDNLGMEMFQGFATAGKKLSDVSKKVDIVGQKVDSMHTDQKDGFDRVEGAISGMHTDMNTRFDTLDEKYGAISRQMNTLTGELQTSTKSLVALTEKIGALIDEKLAE